VYHMYRAPRGDKATTSGGPIPTFVYRRFKMVPPTLEEGFDRVGSVGGDGSSSAGRFEGLSWEEV
jgi:hypothetical protein